MRSISAPIAPESSRTTTRHYPLLVGAAALATYQIYFFPAAGTYFPLSLFLIYACVPFIRRRTADNSLFVLFVAYLALVFVSGAWSPDKGAWGTSVVYGFLFFAGFFSARTFDDRTALDRVVFWFLLFASINAVLVIVYRLSPALEDVFLGSAWRGLFKNPKLLANIELFRPNVYDPDKAGGIFDNANTGAAFSMLCIGATISTFGVKGRLISLYFFLIFSLAVLMSGSKSAAMIFVAGMSVLVLAAVARVGNAYQRVIGFCLVGLLALATVALVAMVASSVESSDFGRDVSDTSEYRFMLWRAARWSFPQHPIRGLGFGGWSDMLSTFAATGVNVSWPPHNSLILAWSESGIFAVLLLLAIWAVLARRLARSIAADPRASAPVGALFALVSVAAMSFGDTFALFGSQNMTVPLGILVALGISQHPDKSRGLH